MTMRLKCSCGAAFSLHGPAAGRIVTCPGCGRKLRVRGPRAGQADGGRQPQRRQDGQSTAQTANDGRLAGRAEAGDAGTAVPAAGADEPAAPAVPDAASGAGEAVAASAAPSSAWQPRPGLDQPAGRRLRARRWLQWTMLAALLLLPPLVVGTLIAISVLRPKDPRQAVAERYLQAVQGQEWVEAARLSVLDVHPRLASVDRVWLSDEEEQPLRGQFAALARFHEQIQRKYRYNPERGRFELKDTFGTGMEVLAALEGAKKKVEQQVEARRKERPPRRSSPEEQLLDDVLARYQAIADLAAKPGALLSSQNLAPTYQDLLAGCALPLSDAERSLAEHYAAAPQKWRRLLGRPFLTLPAGMPFELHQARIRAAVHVPGQSFGQPGQPITLHLVRFIMGSIDTGWRVWSVELGQPTPPAGTAEPSSP